MNDELTVPGRSGSLGDILRHRFLLKLLVSKELKVRYRGSVLGLLWSYVKPGVQFVVFYVALGVFMGLEESPRNPDGLANYAIYLFSGIVLINFFTEALGNASRSIVGNGGLIKKIYLPRQLFPVASVWVSGVHFVPQILILLVACLFNGWRPSLLQLAAAGAGFIIVGMLATGLGLLFGAVNVYFRDAENLVDMLLMIATWASPVLYSWNMVQRELGETFFNVYQLNPITVAVETFHFAFWLPTTDGAEAIPPHLLSVWIPIALVVSAALLLIGQLVFRRLEGRFAQEL
ncbi:MULTISPECIES: ABC transporter permease [unclassified Arthrobacter]|uniref:ABC transporter permease n=1 Tax=unclassified Arthrobacter TaxID=235627 RepID=UPI0021085A7A|nr:MULTISPECIES: ABC transporter permease [unclassified Arthrobacter]MCQ1945388.1 ABC transporter permease [Arthrobacter sp. zg-Y1116]MCQ1985334.1 ABC transporter permease [Arthrobacter sp. zg-Y844]MCQ1994951.1 ABC transporter permease [Arthrobacter sp. zg-Y1171]UWX80990.1 ABC transporter permease [Arthrobacter sp. zg-Y1171]